jgi:hypothetical protein
MSVAGLLTPMAPVVGLHGGVTLTLAPVSGGLVLAVDFRLSPTTGGVKEEEAVQDLFFLRSTSRLSV